MRTVIFHRGIPIVLGCFLLLVSCHKDNATESKPTDDTKIITGEIQPNGGDVRMDGVAAITFPSGSFTQSTTVKLIQSRSEEIQQDFEITAALYELKERPEYEVRINTGSIAPKGIVRVVINLPKEMTDNASAEYGARAFGELFFENSVEQHDNFEAIPCTYYASRQTLEFDLPRYYFTASRSTDGSYEAILKIANARGITYSLGRTTAGNDCDAPYISCPLTSCGSSGDQFGDRFDPITHLPNSPHKGVDFPVPVGQPVKAASDGKVILSTFQLNKKTGKGWGEYVAIRHENRRQQVFTTLYAHLSRRVVAKDATVREGDIIGYSGETGGVTGPHLHLEYILGANAGKDLQRTNPIPHINSTAPRLVGAEAHTTAVNTCQFTPGVAGSPWTVNFDYRDLGNAITPTARLTFEDVYPNANPPYTVPVGSLSTANGTVTSPNFCARFGSAPYISVKVFMTLANGTRSNCIYFNLTRPAGANRSSSDESQVRPSSTPQ